MISVEVKIDPAQKSLRRFAVAMTDNRTTNRKIAVQFQSFVDRNFAREGSLQPVPWAPLKAATLAAKKRQGRSPKILVRTGFMKAAFLSWSDNNEAGIGNNVWYSLFHEEGSEDGTLPQRKMLPTVDAANKIVTDIYSLKVKQDQDKAGL